MKKRAILGQNNGVSALYILGNDGLPSGPVFVFGSGRGVNFPLMTGDYKLMEKLLEAVTYEECGMSIYVPLSSHNYTLEEFAAEQAVARHPVGGVSEVIETFGFVREAALAASR